MLSLARWVFIKDMILVVMMNDDLNIIVTTTKTNLWYLCDIEMVMGFNWPKPLLEAIHVIIEFAQTWDMYVYDFAIIVNICCAKLYNMYLDLEKKHGEKHFKTFLDLHECTNDQLLTSLWIDFATNIQFVIFYFMGKHYQLH